MLSEISTIYKKMKDKVKSEIILTSDDIEKALLCSDFSDMEIYGFWLHENRINPSLSFHKTGKSVSFYKSTGKALLALKSRGYSSVEDAKSSPSTVSMSNYVVLVIDKSSQLNKLPNDGDTVEQPKYKELGLCLSLICRRSINATNLYVNMNQRIHSTINSTIAKLDRNNEFDAILVECLHEYSRLIGYPTVLIKKNGRSFSKSKTCESINSDDLDACIEKNFEKLERAHSFNYTVLLNTESGSKIMCQPLTIGREMSCYKYFIVMHTSANFYSRDQLHLSAMAESFDEVYRKDRKLDLILALRKEMPNKIRKNGSYSLIKESFSEFVASKRELIFSILKAHSLTLRLFNPMQNVLEALICLNAETGDYECELGDISVSKYANSVNAFTYLIGANLFPYVYIRNTNGAIPYLYKNKGLNSTLHVRKHTKCEFCIPFKFRNIVIGTVNIESHVKESFDEDLDFISSLVSILEEKYFAYFEDGDVSWLKERSSFADQLHDLNNLLSTGYFSGEQKNKLKQMFFTQKSNETSLIAWNLGELKLWIESWISDYYSDLLEDSINIVRDIVEVNRPYDYPIDTKILETIEVIVRHLIINIISYSYPNRDKIIITCMSRFRDNVTQTVRVIFKTYGIFDTDDLEILCLKPIHRKNDMAKSEHFGFYTLGLLTRANGGYISISPSSVEATIIEFILPAKFEGNKV